MKKAQTLSVLLALALLCSVSGCAGQSASSAVSSAASPAASQSAASGSVAASSAASSDGYAAPDRSLCAPVGSELKADLNGDGTEDTIYYAADANNEDHPIQSLSINGTEFKDTLNAEGSDVYLYFPDGANYYVTDLDPSDAYRELVIQDLGPSDDPTTYFFRYDGTTLKSLGFVPDFFSSDSFQLDGHGGVRANQRLNLLQTWAATFTWQLHGDALQPVPQDLYTPAYYPGCEQTVTLVQPLKVYSDQSLDAETTTWQPSSDSITFPATDNAEWVELTRGGETGWIHITDFCTLDNDGETNAPDVFNGLFLAD